MTLNFKRYAHYARTALQDLDSISWNLSPSRSVAYVGWLGRGNLGDEAMFLSHQQRIVSGRMMAKAPTNGWSRRLVSLRTKPAADILLVGGGTVLGHTGWLKSIGEVRKLLTPKRFVVLGAGMEDIKFAISKGLATNEALRGWAKLLSAADYVGVRGPKSQQQLWRIGVDAEVIGDAALWFKPQSKSVLISQSPKSTSPYVAINVVGRSNGFDVDEVKRRGELVSYMRGLLDLGLGVVLFGMERRDVYEARLLQNLVPKTQVLAWQASVTRVVDLIKGSELVVAERLHGAILAAASDVPFVMLAYKPKSYDFAESVNAVDSCIAPDLLSADALMEPTLAFMSDKAHSVRVKDAIHTLGTRFDAAHERWMNAA